MVVTGRRRCQASTASEQGDGYRQNIDTLTRIADRHYIIEKCQVVWTCSSKQLRANRKIQQRYLGV